MGEPEEKKPQQHQQGDDPFIDRAPSPHRYPNVHDRKQVSGPRPLQRANTVSPRNLMRREVESPLPKAPLRPISANFQPGHGIRRSVTFLPPKLQLCEETRPKEAAAAPAERASTAEPALASPSEASFTTESVHSTDSERTETATCEAPRPESALNNDRRSPPMSPLTPSRSSRASDVSSSPYNEHDILSMLLSASGPRRALPTPPTATITAPDGSVVSTPLSPRPVDKSERNSAVLERRNSEASSFYSTAPTDVGPAAVSNGSPRRSAVKAAREQFEKREQEKGEPAVKPRQSQDVGSTIAALRRMNSVVSSQSIGSIASTIMGGAGSEAADLTDGNQEGPSTPSARARVPLGTPRSLPQSKSIGSRHYFNLGKNSPTKNSARMQGGGGGGHRKTVSADPRFSGMVMLKSHGSAGSNSSGAGGRKRDVSQSPTRRQQQHARSDGSPRRRKEGRTRGSNLSREPSSASSAATSNATTTTTSSAWAPSKVKLTPAKHLAVEERRRIERRYSSDSSKSSTFQDKEGFLLSSPEGTVQRRWMRM